MGTETLALATSTPYDKLPTVIDIIGNEDEMTYALAKSLAKKLQLQIFLNYNHSQPLSMEHFE